MRLRNSQCVVNACNLTLLFIEDTYKMILDFLFGFFEFLLHLSSQILLFFFEFFNALIQHLNVQFQLLFDFDVISHLGLVLLQLLLVFLRR